MTIVDGNAWHYYQPGFTLIGGGLMNGNQVTRSLASVIPPDVNLVRDSVQSINPTANQVELTSGKSLKYDALVVATGIDVDFNSIKGLQSALESAAPVTSIYSRRFAEKHASWLPKLKEQKNFNRRLNLHFTCPSTAVKCGGAPQKVMYLTEDYLRHEDRVSTKLPKFEVSSLLDARVNEDLDKLCKEQPDHPYYHFTYHITGDAIFGTPHYAQVLEDLRVRRQIQCDSFSELLEVKGESQTAVFRDNNTGAISNVKFDLLHAVPNMYPPQYLRSEKAREAQISDAAGFCQVDAETLQHPVYKNIFALGDSSNLPTSKTAAAVASQAPVLVHNLLSQFAPETSKLKNKDETAIYDGYTSCPIIISGRKNAAGIVNPLDTKLILAEFDYSKQPYETCSWMLGDQRNPSRIASFIKRCVFPPVYWMSFLKGTWYGKDLFFGPNLKFRK
eukprot:GDKJ01019177.1.p1 GENE.GDKJ01019177.1~~GDKJ01019177.1.p1  ORF type:complete len:474 (+),score=98.62 GDKJ01019177.1:86-1423(+)